MRFIRMVAVLVVTASSLFLYPAEGQERKTDGRTAAGALRNVPAERLVYRFTPDVPSVPPDEYKTREPSGETASLIRLDFERRRTEVALLRTVVSPDGRRALALYETDYSEFQIDLYSSGGEPVRTLTPQGLKGVFPMEVKWSPDGSEFAFIGLRSAVSSVGSASQASGTEQVYLCGGDDLACQPLTKREGTIHFYLAWAPDGHALVTLECSEDEWAKRGDTYWIPAGRPRLVFKDGRDRLLNDELTEAFPVWSPDASKVAVAFDTDVVLHDTTAGAQTSLRIPLREPLLAASVAFDQKNSRREGGGRSGVSKARQVKDSAKRPSDTPLSFNPIVGFAWPTSEVLLLQTGFVRNIKGEEIKRWLRWHKLNLEPQR